MLSYYKASTAKKKRNALKSRRKCFKITEEVLKKDTKNGLKLRETLLSHCKECAQNNMKIVLGDRKNV